MILQLTRRAGALSLLAVGAVHIQQYLDTNYRLVPTIGPLFLLNAIGSFAVAALLIAPTERILGGGRRGDLAVGLLAALGVAIAAGSLVVLFLAENGGVFGFAEAGYSTPIMVAIISEALTTLLLVPVAAIELLGFEPLSAS
jgi:hypothetical protein